MNKIKKIKIFDIIFIDANYNYLKKLLDKGGLLVAPSGPGLASIKNDIKYYHSLKNANIVLFDSGYLCLLLKIIKNINVKKFSGLLFLKKFLSSLKNNKEKIFLIDPSESESNANKKYFKKLNINKIYQYVSPIYKKDKIFDIKLLNRIKKIRPKYIIINLGGNVQEVLGYYLKKNLNYKPSIICTGAAIAFLTKKQAQIPDFLDKLHLGWMVRCIFNPLKFIPRYLTAFKLYFIFLNDKNNITCDYK
ncbi:WecB/TagA/CpsF family glycosyltransferase [Candidatus Pelagibacter sp.]|jgi:N-acetylglucosaminyldiphosphoundecaprenol N-acetyl-beta-D-mannosaminyltransferase|nr:WecB/TagA/CpsF family glycosyltransferase [Candidatus Pelagibacter sp.]